MCRITKFADIVNLWVNFNDNKCYLNVNLLITNMRNLSNVGNLLLKYNKLK